MQWVGDAINYAQAASALIKGMQPHILDAPARAYETLSLSRQRQ